MFCSREIIGKIDKHKSLTVQTIEPAYYKIVNLFFCWSEVNMGKACKTMYVYVAK